MIPLRDEIRTGRVPFITIGLIAINVLVFLHERALPTPFHVHAFIAHYAMVPAEVVYAPSADAYQRILTSMFLHGGWMHIIGNMLFLWIFGDNVEDSVGHIRFVFFYLTCGVAAAAAQIFTQPSSLVPMIGASGAISGVLGAYLLLFPRAKVLVLVPIWIFIRFLEVPAWILLILWFAIQLLSGWGTLSASSGAGVAFWAHVGGFIAGLLLIPLFKRRGVKLFR
jgi:membrane associated rhomboid family serine protease